MHTLELENLIKMYIPEFEKEIKGATQEEIIELENISGCSIPEFYRWFLSRVGCNMGKLSFPTVDFSVRKLTQCYRDGWVKPDNKYLLIGHESKIGTLDIYYDLYHENNGDAPVMRRDPVEDENEFFSESFREFLAWSIVLKHGIETYSEVCKGIFIDDNSNQDEGDVLNKLDLVMKDLGFSFPIKTGKYGGIYIGEKATLLTDCPPFEDTGFHSFSLGSINCAELRRILYKIENATALEIEIDENDPRQLRDS